MGGEENAKTSRQLQGGRSVGADRNSTRLPQSPLSLLVFARSPFSQLAFRNIFSLGDFSLFVLFRLFSVGRHLSGAVCKTGPSRATAGHTAARVSFSCRPPPSHPFGHFRFSSLWVS